MGDSRRRDVTIIGAGIAGSALAASLSGCGLSIALVEAQPVVTADKPTAPGVEGFDPRVSALTPQSQCTLEQLGAWEGISAQRLCPYEHMTVWDAEGTATVEFDRDELGVSVLGHIVENRVIVRALHQRLDGCGDVTKLIPEKLSHCEIIDPGGARVELESGDHFDTDLLVAADGALSRVRGMLDFRTREWDYGHQAVVTTVETERPHDATAWQRFMATGPLAFLPLPDIDGRHYCSIVWSVENELAQTLSAMTAEEFCRALEQAFESRLGAVVACAPRFQFPLRQRHAVDYVKSGVALVGDAAHTIHPLAGQGINLGLLDIAALSGEVREAHGRGINPGSLEVLQRYQRRRKGENLAMMAAMDGFKHLFAQRALPVRWLRNAGMRGVSELPWVKQQLMRHAMGIG